LILKSSLLLVLLAPDGLPYYTQVDLFILVNFVLDLIAIATAYALFLYSKQFLNEWYAPALYFFAGMMSMIFMQDAALIASAMRLNLI